MKKKVNWTYSFTIIIPLFLLFGCENKKVQLQEETRVTFRVDSTWSKSPGEINTLQTDVIYFGRTVDGMIHSSRSKISLGDSFVYIYRRVH